MFILIKSWFCLLNIRLISKHVGNSGVSRLQVSMDHVLNLLTEVGIMFVGEVSEREDHVDSLNLE